MPDVKNCEFRICSLQSTTVSNRYSQWEKQFGIGFSMHGREHWIVSRSLKHGPNWRYLTWVACGYIAVVIYHSAGNEEIILKHCLLVQP